MRKVRHEFTAQYSYSVRVADTLHGSPVRHLQHHHLQQGRYELPIELPCQFYNPVKEPGEGD